ncbi:MAG: hypothetical protein Kow0069_07390 [Promethearchaeota archaeon]
MKQIAKERVHILFGLAEEVHATRPERAHRYAQLAKKVAQAARVRLPANYRRRICRGCGHHLIPGLNCRFRMQSRKGRASRVVRTCLDCGHLTRYHVKARTRSRTRTMTDGGK